MYVDVVEMGERPITFTKARRFAPAGARVFGETIGQLEFADEAAIVLDWDNQLGLMPAEVAKPILFIHVVKRLPQYRERNTLAVNVRLDIEDIFGGDNMTAESILDILKELEAKVEEQVAMRKES